MGITEGKNKKNNKKNDNEVKDIYGFTKDGIKSCCWTGYFSYLWI